MNRKLEVIARIAVALVGVGLFGWGLAMVHPGLALAIVGLVVFRVAFAEVW